MTTATNTTPAPKRTGNAAGKDKPKADLMFDPSGANCPPADAPALTPPRSKIEQVLELLGRAEGATIDQLVETTGWLPHTTRAALTGLKKKGHVVESLKPSDGPRVYRITGNFEAA